MQSLPGHLASIRPISTSWTLLGYKRQIINLESRRVPRGLNEDEIPLQSVVEVHVSWEELGFDLASLLPPMKVRVFI